MKNNLIKSVKQLPSWFKLKNYEKAKYFNANEWYEELMPRFFMRKDVQKLIGDKIDLQQRWELIKKEGLLFYSKQKQDITHHVTSICPQIHMIQESQKQNLEHEFTSLASLANLYVYGSFWLLDIPEREKIAQKIKELFHIHYDGSNEVVQLMQSEAAEWAAKPYDNFPSDLAMGLNNKFAYARIKLDASDEQIKKDFAMWLAYERKKRDCPAPKKNFSDIELDSWYESSVLPYLDLTLWAEIETSED